MLRVLLLFVYHIGSLLQTRGSSPNEPLSGAFPDIRKTLLPLQHSPLPSRPEPADRPGRGQCLVMPMSRERQSFLQQAQQAANKGRTPFSFLVMLPKPVEVFDFSGGPTSPA